MTPTPEAAADPIVAPLTTDGELDVFHFGNTPELAAKLAHLVVKGVKRGTTCWLAAVERDGSPVPRVGTVSIVTDGFGYAQCAIRTERVERLRQDDRIPPDDLLKKRSR